MEETKMGRGGKPLASDRDIEDCIHAFLKSHPEIKYQEKQINCDVIDGVAYLYGWVADPSYFYAIVEIAQNCGATSVATGEFKGQRLFLTEEPDEDHPLRRQPGDACVTGFEKCGSICVPTGTCQRRPPSLTGPKTDD